MIKQTDNTSPTTEKAVETSYGNNDPRNSNHLRMELG